MPRAGCGYNHAARYSAVDVPSKSAWVIEASVLPLKKSPSALTIISRIVYHEKPLDASFTSIKLIAVPMHYIAAGHGVRRPRVR